MWMVWIRALTSCEPDDISLVYVLDHYTKSDWRLEETGYRAGERRAVFEKAERYFDTFLTWIRHCGLPPFLCSGNQTISIYLAPAFHPNSVYLNTHTQMTQTSQSCLVDTYTTTTYQCPKPLPSIPPPCTDTSPSPRHCQPCRAPNLRSSTPLS